MTAITLTRFSEGSRKASRISAAVFIQRPRAISGTSPILAAILPERGETAAVTAELDPRMSPVAAGVIEQKRGAVRIVRRDALSELASLGV